MEELHAVLMQVMASKRTDALAIPLKLTDTAASDSLRAIEKESYQRHRAQEIAERKAINNSLGGDAPLVNAPRQGFQPIADVKPTPIYMQGKQINK